MKKLRAQQKLELSILKAIPCYYYFDEETWGGVIHAIRRDARDGKDFDDFIQPSYTWNNKEAYKRFRKHVRNRLHKRHLAKLTVVGVK